MRRILAGITTIVVTASSCARLPNLGGDSGDPALPRDGEAAVVFAPGVVSTGDVFASTFTPDGRTVVFTKFAPPRMMLMTSRFADGRWSAPATLPFSGTYRDLDPAFSPDGARLYFTSWRPIGASPSDTTNGADSWYVDRVGSTWSAPVHLSGGVNSAEQDFYPSVTRRGMLYFDSFRSMPRRRLVYRAHRADAMNYGEAEPLDTVINADSGASNFFIDPDERYAVFSGVRPEGHGGPDLYVSWRRNGSWSTPKNLGSLVNTAATEFCPFVSSDGRYLHFTRISTASGQTARNVYVVRFDALLSELANR